LRQPPKQFAPKKAKTKGLKKKPQRNWKNWECVDLLEGPKTQKTKNPKSPAKPEKGLLVSKPPRISSSQPKFKTKLGQRQGSHRARTNAGQKSIDKEFCNLWMFKVNTSIKTSLPEN
jgi:hypothetical protein